MICGGYHGLIGSAQRGARNNAQGVWSLEFH